MKRILFSFICLCCILCTNAQEASSILIGVVVPEQMEGLSASQLHKLQTKLETICTNNGIEASLTPNGFVLYPVFEFYSDDVIEGGMQKIYSVKMELTLFIKQIGGANAASVSRIYKGAGNTRDKAIVDAIGKISPSDGAYSKFIEQGKTKIVAYYQTHCKQIIADIKMRSQQEQYEEALAMCFSIPAEVACYDQICQLIGDTYKAYQTKICYQYLQEAKSANSTQDYDAAAEALLYILPTMSCYKEAQTLLTIVQKNFTEKEQRDWEFKLKQHNDQVNLQSQTINAAKEVAKAYCSQKVEVHYQEIFR